MSAGPRPAYPSAMPWLAFSAALTLYCATLAPGLLWADSAKLAIQVAQADLLGYGHGRHPLHTLLPVWQRFAREYAGYVDCAENPRDHSGTAIARRKDA